MIHMLSTLYLWIFHFTQPLPYHEKRCPTAPSKSSDIVYVCAGGLRRMR